MASAWFVGMSGASGVNIAGDPGCGNGLVSMANQPCVPGQINDLSGDCSGQGSAAASFDQGNGGFQTTWQLQWQALARGTEASEGFLQTAKDAVADCAAEPIPSFGPVLVASRNAGPTASLETQDAISAQVPHRSSRVQGIESRPQAGNGAAVGLVSPALQHDGVGRAHRSQGWGSGANAGAKIRSAISNQTV